MKKNKYDDAQFFEAYSRMSRSSLEGLTGFRITELAEPQPTLEVLEAIPK